MMLDSTLGEFAASFAMVKTWVADFKRARTSSNKDAERSGRAKSARTEAEDMVLKVHKIVVLIVD
jgi:hypothetical protein